MKEKQLLYRLSILWRKIEWRWFQQHGGVHESIHKWWVGSVLKAIHIKFWCIHSRQFAMPSYPYVSISCFIHFFENSIAWFSWWSFCFLPIDQPVYWILSKFRGGPYLNIWCLKQCFGTKYPEVSLIWKLKLLFILLFRPMALKGTLNVKSRNVDILGPVELIVWPELGNLGDWGE